MQVHGSIVAASLVGAALCVGGCHREATERPDAFSWSEELAPGTTLHLRTTNGSVTVRGSAEPRAHVQGSKRWRRGRERDVRFVVARDGHDVYVCAIWRRRGGRCGDERYRPSPPRWVQMFGLLRRRSDMAASLDVALPAGVRVDASTVNGQLTITEASGDIRAETINGDIRASTIGGGLQLKTVNGSIRARAAALDKDAPVELESVNGSVVAEVPSPLDADVSLATVNGHISTDFPLAVTGSQSKRKLNGTLGAGGRPVKLTTVNGSVELKSRS